MRYVIRFVVLSVTLIALTGILKAAVPNFDQLRQEGRELQKKAEKLRAEGRMGEAEEVVQEAERMFRRADEVGRVHRPEVEGGQPDRQPGVLAGVQSFVRQIQEMERVLKELRRNNRGDQADQLQRDLNQFREKLDRMEREMRGGQPGGPGPGMHGRPDGRPEGPRPEQRREHLKQAVEHLHAAAGCLKAVGMHDLAQKLAGEADRLKNEMGPTGEMGDIGRAIQDLREEVGRLRNEVNDLRRRVDQH